MWLQGFARIPIKVFSYKLALKPYNRKQPLNQYDEVQNMNKYDVAVIGGGMVGAAVALGFAEQGRRVVVIEGKAPTPYAPQQAMDVRVSAISNHSVALLESLGAWQAIQSMRACPYKRLETWEHPECRTRFHSDDVACEQLGYIVENRIIQLGLWSQFSAWPNLALRCPVTVEHIEYGPVNQVTLSDGEVIEAGLIVGADGAHSRVRRSAGIGITAWDYRQHCMLINVKTDLPQQDITWQQFTPSGPRSFLPLCGHQASLVWYDTPKRIRQLKAMTPLQLASEIKTHFPAELGGLEVIQSGSFLLTRRHAQRYYTPHCVLVGDAAHTINPLAGQGVNLGFKDVEALLNVTRDHEEILLSHLTQYERRRRPDNLLMQTGMDLFYKGFSNDKVPLKWIRNAALKVAEHSGPIKHQVLRYALGMGASL